MILSWQNIAELAGSAVMMAGIIGGILWIWLRPKISSEFASKAALAAEVVRSKEREADIEGRSNERLSHLEVRIVQVETEVRALPTKDDHHKLALQIEHQAGTIKQLQKSVDQVSKGVTRIENLLLNRPED